MGETDNYKLLEVDPEADPDVIEAAYRVLSRKLDPESDPIGLHRVRQTELDHAFAILSNSIQRRAYDTRRAEMLPMGPGAGRVDFGPRLAAGALSERVQAGLNGENLGKLTLEFGRSAVCKLGDLAAQDPEYLRWLSRHSSGIRYRKAILRLLRERDETRAPLHVQG